MIFFKDLALDNKICSKIQKMKNIKNGLLKILKNC